jgi:hypothetical protein
MNRLVPPVLHDIAEIAYSTPLKMLGGSEIPIGNHF